MYFIPRYIGIPEVNLELVQSQLVCFCDATVKAYAIAVYLHQSFDDTCKVDLIFSKTRLAPQNTTMFLLACEHSSLY